VTKLTLTYDRAGRSEGIAYVTYEYPEDASKAIREFDGANAKGMAVLDTGSILSNVNRTTNSLGVYSLWSFCWTTWPRSWTSFERLVV